ncbi:MAG: hypothetical protein ABW252_17155 [Polyangiales bacterium]
MVSCLVFARRSVARVVFMLAMAGTSACAPDAAESRGIDPSPLAPLATAVDAPAALPSADATQAMQRPAFCARPGDDGVRDVFCVGAPPAVESLVALQRLLGFDPMAQRSGAAAAEPPKDGEIVFHDSIALLGHSTALGGRLVSQINPRAILIHGDSFLTYQRGVQRVEVATRDRTRGTFTFYLFAFTQRCNEAATGCGPGDLFTPRVESDWRTLGVEDDEDLKNTPSDCRQCHQRARARPALLMRELAGPWTHFFSHDVEESAPTPEPSGRDLVQDYLRAKGDETYAGLPVGIMRGTTGLALEVGVGGDQPLFFDSTTLQLERWFAPEGMRETPARSATWDRNFEAFKRGEQLALPFYGGRATDPEKLRARSEAYTRYRQGLLPAEALPDLSDVFSDDPRLRAEIGLQTTPDATPADALIQACGPCHNDKLDPTITRARFSVAVGRLSATARELAIARLSLPASDLQAMPPHEARALAAGAREALIAYLRQPPPSADGEKLEHAAREGMAREVPPTTSRPAVPAYPPP